MVFMPDMELIPSRIYILSMELLPIFKRAYWTLAAGGLLYVAFIISLTYPTVQRL